MPEINTGIVIFLTYKKKYKKILKFVKNYNASNIWEKCRKPVNAVVVGFVIRRIGRIVEKKYINCQLYCEKCTKTYIA